MVMNAACLVFHLIQTRMKRLFWVMLCSLCIACSVAARKTSDDTITFCKLWVNGVRYAFTETFNFASARIERAKKCFVLKLPNASAEVAVYRKSKEHFIVSINGKCYDYDASDNKRIVATDEIPDQVLKNKLELWGKRTGYCMAVSRQKENVLIIYER